MHITKLAEENKNLVIARKWYFYEERGTLFCSIGGQKIHSNANCSFIDQKSLTIVHVCVRFSTLNNTLQKLIISFDAEIPSFFFLILLFLRSFPFYFYCCIFSPHIIYLYPAIFFLQHITTHFSSCVYFAGCVRLGNDRIM